MMAFEKALASRIMSDELIDRKQIIDYVYKYVI